MIIIDGYLIDITPETASYCKTLLLENLNINKWNEEICGFPKAGATQYVGWVMLESSFPFNAPKNISKGAGIEFRQSVALHTGLCIIIAGTSIDLLVGTDADESSTFSKFSIEFSADNYADAIFPYKNNNGNIQWNNSASIYITNPLNTKLWLNSRIIAQTSGLVYNKFILQIYDKIISGAYNVFQPISILTPNVSSFESLSPINQNQYGTLLIPSTASFTLIEDAIYYLQDLECPIGAFLSLASTAFFYFQCNNDGNYCNNLQVVPMENSIYLWYENLKECIIKFNGNGAIDWENIQICYNESYAYVYMNSTYVYKVSLLNVTDYKSSNCYNTTCIYNPMIFRYLLDIPLKYNIKTPTLTAMDYLYLVCYSLIIVGCIGFKIHERYSSPSSKKSKETAYFDEFENRIKQDTYFS